MNVRIDTVRLEAVAGRIARIADRLKPACRAALTSQEGLKLLMEIGQQGMLAEVYSVAPGEYERTYAMLNNVQAGAESDDPPVAYIEIPHNAETAAVGKKDKQYTYARFMLPQDQGDHDGGFLALTSPHTIPRPFLDAWKQAVEWTFPKRLEEEISRAVEGA
jgi:hypothetical protein